MTEKETQKTREDQKKPQPEKDAEGTCGCGCVPPIKAK